MKTWSKDLLMQTGNNGQIADVQTDGQHMYFLSKDRDLYIAGYNTDFNSGSDLGHTMDAIFERKHQNIKEFYLPSQSYYYCVTNDGLFYEKNSTTPIAENVKSAWGYSDNLWYIDNNDDLYVKGSSNSYGQLGTGDTSSVSTFTKRAENVAKVRCNSYASWYLTKDGDLYICGYGGYGTQGSGSTSDIYTFTKRASNVKDFKANYVATFYITNDGDLYYSGLTAMTNFSNVYSFIKKAENVKELFITDYQIISGNGSDFSYMQILTNDNKLYGNAYSYIHSPDYPDAQNVLYADAYNNNDNAWYVTNDGKLYGKGSNTYGQQGSGDNSTVSTYTKRAENVIKVCPAYDSTFYITDKGELFGCGSNQSGMQGNPKTYSSNQLTFENKMPYLCIPVAKKRTSSTSSTTFTINKAGKYMLELVGGGGGGHGATSYYTTSGVRGAYASTGGGAGATYVGILQLTTGEYTIKNGSYTYGSMSTVYSNNTATVNSSSGSSDAASYIKKGSSTLISAAGGNLGYVWADYNASPYVSGTGPSGGTVTISDSSVIFETLFSSSGGSGSYTGSRVTSTSGSRPSGGARGISAYCRYGWGCSGWDASPVSYSYTWSCYGLARLCYLPYGQ